jgi:hypothetical protein
MRCVINGAFIHISISSFPGDVGRHSTHPHTKLDWIK